MAERHLRMPEARESGRERERGGGRGGEKRTGEIILVYDQCGALMSRKTNTLC